MITLSDDNSSHLFAASPAQSSTILGGYLDGENYFFEWCVWIGYAIYGLAYTPWGLVALLGQAIIFGSIWGVTGIPPTEAQSLRSKGEAYREYQARVSRFLPMPPKQRVAHRP